MSQIGRRFFFTYFSINQAKSGESRRPLCSSQVFYSIKYRYYCTNKLTCEFENDIHRKMDFGKIVRKRKKSIVSVRLSLVSTSDISIYLNKFLHHTEIISNNSAFFHNQKHLVRICVCSLIFRLHKRE